MKHLGAATEKHWSLLVFIIAVPLYLINIDYGDLWNDEAFTKQLITFSLPDMIRLVAGDFHPPLYFLGLKAFVAVAGSNAVTLRVFSVIGVLATLLLICTMGKRVLGRNAALLFCLMIMTVPMVATYSHTARMYTWAAFAVTGVFLSSCALIRAPSNRDLLWLGFFTLLGAYLHYYCILAAFSANAYVFLGLVVKKNRLWRRHLIVSAVVLSLYLPWLLTLFQQAARVKADFYVPEVSALWVALCYLVPFWHNFYPATVSIPLTLMHAAITVASVIIIVRRKESESKPALFVSLVIFNGTIVLAMVISLLIRPILLYRYIATVMTMVAVPPALFFVELRKRTVRRVLFAALLGVGIYASFDAGKDSIGAYQAAATFLKQHHPNIKKVVHIVEVTASTFTEYNAMGPWEQLWLDNENTASYTNMKVFRGLKTVRSLQEVLEKDERFCLVDFPAVELNRKNFDLVMRQSQKIGVDTISDDKVAAPAYRPKILLYQLQYKGEQGAGKDPKD